MELATCLLMCFGVCVCLCSVWHYIVQGLFGVGLVVLLIALKTASFHVCCCHCCRDSYAIATVIGSMIMIGRKSIRFNVGVRRGRVSGVQNPIKEKKFPNKNCSPILAYTKGHRPIKLRRSFYCYRFSVNKCLFGFIL